MRLEQCAKIKGAPHERYAFCEFELKSTRLALPFGCFLRRGFLARSLLWRRFFLRRRSLSCHRGLFLHRNRLLRRLDFFLCHLRSDGLLDPRRMLRSSRSFCSRRRLRRLGRDDRRSNRRGRHSAFGLPSPLSRDSRGRRGGNFCRCCLAASPLRRRWRRWWWWLIRLQEVHNLVVRPQLAVQQKQERFVQNLRVFR